MSIPDKTFVINMINEKLGSSLYPYKGKQIIYQTMIEGKCFIVCTPSSKIHRRGHGWFDLTTKQVNILDKAYISFLVVRVEGAKVYYLNFKELRMLMTNDAIHSNSKEGDHWKFYVWENFIEIRGKKEVFKIEPIKLNPLS